jgi:hypothetical protein
VTGNRVIRVTSGAARELLAQPCTRCGAVGTHYLTCPSLRLPPGYRLSEDSLRVRPISAEEVGDSPGRRLRP